MTIENLPTGAQIRCRGPRNGRVVLFLGGGGDRDVPGAWSASAEYLCRRLERTLPDLGLAETKYRIRSWRRHEMCIADGAAALDRVARAGAQEVILVGFSLGGAVCTQICRHPLVRTLIGLAPWLPEALPLDAMADRAFHVLHGSLDPLPATPGVSPESSRAGFERALTAGAAGSYTIIPGAVHAIALRTPWGALVPAPRARCWGRRVEALIEGARDPGGRASIRHGATSAGP